MGWNPWWWHEVRDWGPVYGSHGKRLKKSDNIRKNAQSSQESWGKTCPQAWRDEKKWDLNNTLYVLHPRFQVASCQCRWNTWFGKHDKIFASDSDTSQHNSHSSWQNLGVRDRLVRYLHSQCRQSRRRNFAESPSLPVVARRIPCSFCLASACLSIGLWIILSSLTCVNINPNLQNRLSDAICIINPISYQASLSFLRPAALQLLQNRNVHPCVRHHRPYHFYPTT